MEVVMWGLMQRQAPHAFDIMEHFPEIDRSTAYRYSDEIADLHFKYQVIRRENPCPRRKFQP